MSQRIRAALAGLLSIAAHDVCAYGSGQFNTNLTRCNTCHTGGDAPRVKFSPAERVAKVGARFQISAGKPATLVLDVRTLAGKGLGFAIAADEGLTLESTRDDTRVDRQILGHARVLFVKSGRYQVPFQISAPPASCGRTLSLRASVLAANRDGAPSGDGVAGGQASIVVNCAPAAKPPAAREPLKP